MKKEHKKLINTYLSKHKRMLEWWDKLDSVGFTNDGLFDDIYSILDENLEHISSIIGGDETCDILSYWVYDLNMGEPTYLRSTVYYNKNLETTYDLSNLKKLFKAIDKNKKDEKDDNF